MYTTTTNSRALTIMLGALMCGTLFFSYTTAHAAAVIGETKSITQEYEVVAVSERYQDGIAVFAIEFTLTAFGADMYLPPQVTRAGEGTGMTYAILDGDKRETKNGIAAAVLIPHEVVAGETMHRIAKGETRRFTLLAVYAIEPGAHDDYLLKVSRLPLYDSQGTVRVDLNPSEIEELHTKFVNI